LQAGSARAAAARILTLLGFLLAPAAQAFDLVDTQGTHHRLAEAHGHWVVVNFWATWCVPCIQEIPEIALFHREHPDVQVIGVAMDVEDVAKAKAFAGRVGHDYPLVISDEGVERQLGSPRALPTTRIYDPAGKLVYDKPGRVDRKLLEEKTGSASSAQRAFKAESTRFGYSG